MLDGVKNVKSHILFPFVTELFERGQSVKFAVTGMSMFPFLREGIDSVEAIKADFNSIKYGDIVLILRNNEDRYIMHRVIEKEVDCFFIVGDAQTIIEGPIYPEQIIAFVSAIWRDDKRIECSDKKLRFLTILWLKLRPFRGVILKIARKLRIWDY